MNLLRVANVAKKLDIGVSTVWKLAKRDPTFPRPIKLYDGASATAWVEKEIDDWVLTRMQTRKEMIE